MNKLSYFFIRSHNQAYLTMRFLPLSIHLCLLLLLLLNWCLLWCLQSARLLCLCGFNTLLDTYLALYLLDLTSAYAFHNYLLKTLFVLNSLVDLLLLTLQVNDKENYIPKGHRTSSTLVNILAFTQSHFINFLILFVKILK